MTDIIRLNVGGKPFLTSKSTLLNTADKDTFFSRLFEGKFCVQTLPDESIVIDRDPKTFGMLLNILRGYPFDRKSLSKYELACLYHDVDFYGYSQFLPLDLPDLSEIKFIKHSDGPTFWVSVPKLSFRTPLLKNAKLEKIDTPKGATPKFVFRFTAEADKEFDDWLCDLKDSFSDSCGKEITRTSYNPWKNCKIDRDGIEKDLFDFDNVDVVLDISFVKIVKHVSSYKLQLVFNKIMILNEEV